MTNELDLCGLTIQRQNEWIHQIEQMGTERRVHYLIDLGRSLPQLPKNLWEAGRRVVGCQSEMYLQVDWPDGHMQAQIGSDALVSRGLAALVLSTYQGCSAEQVLRCSFFLPEQVGMEAWLTPGRANGLSSLLNQLKQAALAELVRQS